jgi:hypothetical protein
MAKVTEHYKISGPVEFIVVNVTKDNRLFVDPRAVRLERGPKPFVAQANQCTKTFFDEVVDCVVSGKKSEEQRGLDLLQHFKEPKETRLGLSKKGFDGHGGAEDVGQWIWHVLSTDIKAFVGVGLLKHIEDIPIFVEGVDKDITSDLTTRIIFEPLAEFTQAMVAKHPEFTRGRHKTRLFDRQVWNPSRRRWEEKALDLPVAAGKPLLLVPKHWARHALLMSSGRYYDTTMLSFVQDERAVPDARTGKPIKDSKDVLKGKKEFERGHETIVRVTQQALEKQEDLLDKFRAFVDGRYERLDDDEIEKRTR